MVSFAAGVGLRKDGVCARHASSGRHNSHKAALNFGCGRGFRLGRAARVRGGTWGGAQMPAGDYLNRHL